MPCHHISSFIIIHIDHQRSGRRIYIQGKISIHFLCIISLIPGIIKQNAQNLHHDLWMLVSFAYNYIFIIPECRIYFNSPPGTRSQVIRLPVRVFILAVFIHQRIVRRPPEPEKSPAFSLHNKITDIILCTQCKIRIQNPSAIKIMQTGQRILRLFSQRSIHDLPLRITDPLFRISLKIFEYGIHGITGTDSSHKIRITHQTYRFLISLCAHPVLLKSLDHRKSILQCFRLCKSQLFYPVTTEPQKLRTMINGSFRKCKKLPIKSPGFQKFISIAFIHLPDPV